MRTFNLQEPDRKNILIQNLVLIILLYLSRTAIPVLKYPFLVFYTGFMVYSIVIFRYRLISSLRDFFIDYFIPIILANILFLAYILSYKQYLIIFKDLINSVILFSIFYFLSLIIRTKEDLKNFYIEFIKLIIILAVLISIFGLINYFNTKSIFELALKSRIISFIIEEASMVDYNFALLPVFMGIAGIFNSLKKDERFQMKLVYNLSLLICSLNIVFNSSRRGIIVLVLIIGILLITQIISIFRKSSNLKIFSANTRFYLLVFTLLTIGIYTFIFHTPYRFKYKSLQLINVTNVKTLKERLAQTSFRYATIINFKISYSELYKTIWSPKFFYPLDPDSGWGTRIHKTTFPLEGNNASIVPPKTTGYLMDSTCNASTWNGNAYSYTQILKKKTDENDSLFTSVYCYVSDDFNGEWVHLSTEGETQERMVSEYDLEMKGTWQKLILNRICSYGNIGVYLYFSKYGVSDFSSLKGHVIFAYPTYKVISNKVKNPTISKSIKISHNIYLNPQPDIYKESNFTSLITRTYEIVRFHEATHEKWIHTMGTHSPVISFSQDTNFIKDHDPLREWIANIFSEDTIYLPPDMDIKQIEIQNSFLGSRVNRWKYSFQIFLKEYNFRQRLTGGGFAFLNWYGDYFHGDPKRIDYPHNPFLSILLYSGIIGLIVYLYFIFRIVTLYYHYLRKYILFVLFFTITFFFTFFSGGSPFDPPVMGFFALIPFFINSVYKRNYN